MDSIINKILTPIDQILIIALKISGFGSFQSLIFRLKVYKTLNRRLYERTWKKIVSTLTFLHQQIDLSIEKDGKKTTYKAIDLSKFAKHKGWKISFTKLKNSSGNRRHLLIIFEKNGIEKFEDDIGYCLEGTIISVKKCDSLSAILVFDIIKLFELIEFDSPDYRVEKEIIEKEA